MSIQPFNIHSFINQCNNILSSNTSRKEKVDKLTVLFHENHNTLRKIDSHSLSPEENEIFYKAHNFVISPNEDVETVIISAAVRKREMQQTKMRLRGEPVEPEKKPEREKT